MTKSRNAPLRKPTHSLMGGVILMPHIIDQLLLSNYHESFITALDISDKPVPTSELIKIPYITLRHDNEITHWGVWQVDRKENYLWMWSGFPVPKVKVFVGVVDPEATTDYRPMDTFVYGQKEYLESEVLIPIQKLSNIHTCLVYFQLENSAPLEKLIDLDKFKDMPLHVINFNPKHIPLFRKELTEFLLK